MSLRASLTPSHSISEREGKYFDVALKWTAQAQSDAPRWIGTMMKFDPGEYEQSTFQTELVPIRQQFLIYQHRESEDVDSKQETKIVQPVAHANAGSGSG